MGHLELRLGNSLFSPLEARAVGAGRLYPFLSCFLFVGFGSSKGFET